MLLRIARSQSRAPSSEMASCHAVVHSDFNEGGSGPPSCNLLPTKVTWGNQLCRYPHHARLQLRAHLR